MPISKSTTFGRGLLASSGATITANGVGISTVGTKSNAVHAYSGDEGATGHDTADSAFVTLDGGSVSTTGSDSYGLSDKNKGPVITATGATGNHPTNTTAPKT